MRRLPAFSATILVALGVLAGCGSGDDAQTEDGGSEAPSGDEAASGDDSPAPVDLPDPGDLPVPFPDGVIFEISRTDAGYVFYYPVEDGDQITAFYDEWTAAQSDSYERSEPVENNTSWSFFSELGEDVRLITVERGFDGGQNFGDVTIVQVLYEAGGDGG